MTIEQAIEKAVKAGWNMRRHEYVKQQNEEGVPREVIFLDPTFWQSLGRAMRWEYTKKDISGEFDFIVGKDEWRMQWHRFIDHLADNKTAEEFFKILT